MGDFAESKRLNSDLTETLNRMKDDHEALEQKYKALKKKYKQFKDAETFKTQAAAKDAEDATKGLLEEKDNELVEMKDKLQKAH